MPNFIPPGTGWHPGLPDFRDYTLDCSMVQEILGQLKRLQQSHTTGSRRPVEVDLREFLPDVYNQGSLNSSTTHACLGLVEYFDRRAHGIMIPPSRLFHYRNTRKLLHRTDDSGADLRTGIKAMIRFGIPPECYWPYDIEKSDEEPDAFLYSFLDEKKSICPVRLDASNSTGAETLDVVKSFLAAGFPSIFGFPIPSSLSWDADIPYRPRFDFVCGGQAVIAVGYDDRRLRSAGGALLIRNSWGSQWGEEGYGWLPYAYVESQLAVEFWTLLGRHWLKSGEFRRPRFLP